MPATIGSMRIAGAVLLVLAGLAPRAQAHNGAVAIAVPVQGITIDGDLSDWPEGMRRYSIALPEYGVKPQDEQDFQGSFRIGYNAQENALYVAVEVQDESAAIDTTSAAYWDTQDGCDVYLDVIHKEEKSSTAQHVMWGNTKKVYGGGALADVEVMVQRKEWRHYYEWRIEMGRMREAQVRLYPGTTLGVDVVVGDKDKDGSFSWMAWGRGTAKARFPESIGDAVLVESETSTGKLYGRMQWEEGGEAVSRGKVRVQSSTSETFWVQAVTDAQGAYAVELPAGAYRVGVAGREWQTGKSVAIALEAGSKLPVDLVKALPRGQSVPAGKGRSWRSGPGNRQGVWLTLDASDGLPAPVINALYQDRAGHLWLGTTGGVIRYDGARFVAFTAEDGLASNEVTSILEDRAGHLWFGTRGGGVSRYDGKRFTTFTTEEGLADNVVQAMLEDREGQLWFGTLGGGVSRYDGEHFTTFTAEDGLASNVVQTMLEDREGHLWFGTWGGGVSRYDGKHFTTFTTQDGLSNNIVVSMLEDREGQLWFGTEGGGVSRYDGKHFTTFTIQDGLADSMVISILEDRSGHLWFGTDSRGVSRYDGKRFITFTAQDGLAGTWVAAILQDREGHLWFGTEGGMSRYSGEEFRTFTAQDGLADNRLNAILEDRAGQLWFGTAGGGVSRYDGKGFRTFTAKEGLAGNWPTSILEDRTGRLWFATREGVSRYDGKGFRTFTTKEGLGENGVWSMLEDRAGDLWFGTAGGGASRYDGERFTAFTIRDGLTDNTVLSMLEDREGHLWFGTLRGGVSRYDGKRFTTFTTRDGLAGNNVGSILQDREGHLWFGTEGGVSQYDGVVFQSLRRQDGLAHNIVQQLLQDRHGDIWIATIGGATRLHHFHSPPPVSLTDVVADRRYGPVEEILLPSSQPFLAFEFQGISFKTRPGQLVYLYRLEGYDPEWKQTRENRVEYTDLPRGEYVFQVKAVDRDLDYSETPAQVRVIVHPPYGQMALAGGLGAVLIGLVLVGGYALRKRRDLHRAERALLKDLETELQTAHNLQMGLMPREAPRIPGFEFAGRCFTANHVGGDLFKYYQLPQDRLLGVLADVTGHAMDAAVPLLIFSGILESQLELGGSLEELFRRLNRLLHRTLPERTFVCLAMGELDLRTRMLRLSNGGCPYPYHYRAATDEVVEIQLDTYPLGVRPDTVYSVVEVPLLPGDWVVLCSDGIMEAANAAGELFGYERTAAAIRRGCREDLGATAFLERLIQEVKTFSQGVPQGDDQTVLLLKVEPALSAHYG